MQRILRVNKDVSVSFEKGSEVAMSFEGSAVVVTVESYEVRRLHDRVIHVAVVVSEERQLCCVFLNSRPDGLAGDTLIDGPRIANRLESIPLQKPPTSHDVAYGWGV